MFFTIVYFPKDGVTFRSFTMALFFKIGREDVLHDFLICMFCPDYHIESRSFGCKFTIFYTLVTLSIPLIFFRLSIILFSLVMFLTTTFIFPEKMPSSL